MKGNIRKMKTMLADPVCYALPIGDEELALNTHIGEKISLHYTQQINCIACGRKTNKSFAQGHCYPCFRTLAACDMCIMKPETCHYAAGSCREPSWGEANCFQPHYVYLANSSAVKVGITRGSQIPTRWIDQGATQALPVFRVASRYQSGLLEVILKQHVSDRTDWRKMLRAEAEAVDLKKERDKLLCVCEAEITAIRQQYGEQAIEILDETTVSIHYPLQQYPVKIKSLNFDKCDTLSGRLLGIKGQYLILDSGVLNMRKFSGYHIDVDFC